MQALNPAYWGPKTKLLTTESCGQAEGGLCSQDHPSRTSGKATCRRTPAEALLPETWVQNWQKRERVMDLQTWIFL